MYGLGGSLHPVSAVLPEIFETCAELAAAEGHDGIRPMSRPVHSASLEARADHDLAAGLQDASRGTQTLRMKLGIAHAVTVAANVGGAFARFLIFFCVAIESL